MKQININMARSLKHQAKIKPVKTTIGNKPSDMRFKSQP